jgi:hypothetical protein
VARVVLAEDCFLASDELAAEVTVVSKEPTIERFLAAGNVSREASSSSSTCSKE